MFSIKKIIPAFFILFFTVPIFADTHNIETIVMIRHGEKPDNEIGQLDCQGLNRSLLLPEYFKTHFAKPDYIFAPNPSDQIENEVSGEYYSYQRPLATIEPTAIGLDMPVDSQIAFNEPIQLLRTLLKSQYHSATIYVAWEHGNIQKFAHAILQRYDNDAEVKLWTDDDYNRVYVFTIDWNKKPATLQFEVTSEGFESISKVCPK